MRIPADGKAGCLLMALVIWCAGRRGSSTILQ